MIIIQVKNKDGEIIKKAILSNAQIAQDKAKLEVESDDIVEMFGRDIGSAIIERDGDTLKITFPEGTQSKPISAELEGFFAPGDELEKDAIEMAVNDRMCLDEELNELEDYNSDSCRFLLRLQDDNSGISQFAADELGLLDPLALASLDGLGDPFGDFLRTPVDQDFAIDMREFPEELVVNDPPPIAIPDFFTISQSETVNSNVLTNDFDPAGEGGIFVRGVNDSRALVGEVIVTPKGGVFTINPDGTINYDPNGAFDFLGPGETATDTFSYTNAEEGDPENDFDRTTVTVTIIGENDDPTARDDMAMVMEDGEEICIDVLANDTDPDINQTLMIKPLEINGDGEFPSEEDFYNQEVVILNGEQIRGNVRVEDNQIKYDPGEAFQFLGDSETATETFTYGITDGFGGMDTATVKVTIKGVNDDPNAVDDNYSTDEDTVLTIDNPFEGILNNDFDPDINDELLVTTIKIDGDTFNIGDQIVLDSGAILMVNEDGTLSYDPNNQFEGLNEGDIATETFQYCITDQNGGTSSATVTITINGVNDAPIITNQTIAVAEVLPEDLPEEQNNSVTTNELIRILQENNELFDILGSDGNPLGESIEIDGPREWISITSVDNSNGTFQWTEDGGMNWMDIDPFTSDSNALNLATPPDESVKIRFLPNEDFFGEARITVRGWDQSDGIAPQTEGVVITETGGTSAYSALQQTLVFIVEPVNDAPECVKNNGVAIAVGGMALISSDLLMAEDAEDGANELIYTLTSSSEDGNLLLDGEILSEGDTFTQQDINDGLLKFMHTEDSTEDTSFSVKVSDSEGLTTEEKEFNITISETIVELDDENITTIDGSEGSRLGFSVSNAGDVVLGDVVDNGPYVATDGLEDVIVGAPNADDSAPDGGAAIVVLGSDEPGSEPTTYQFNGVVPGGNAGYSVSGLGDVNGATIENGMMEIDPPELMLNMVYQNPVMEANPNHDGTPRFLIGAPGTVSGAIGHIFEIQDSSEDPALLFNGSPDILGRTYLADGSSLAGTTVADAGDVNRDGLPDIVATFPGTAQTIVAFGQTGTQTEMLPFPSTADGSNFGGVFGTEMSNQGAAGAGDFNGNDFDDIILSNGNNSIFLRDDEANTITQMNGAAGELTGFSVSSAGDVNLDGLSDILIGAPGADINGDEDAGKAYLVFGTTSTSTIDLKNLGSGGFAILNDESAGDMAGWSVSGAGDVNGDGMDDLIIGVPFDDAGGLSDAGAAYVIFGKTDGTNINLSDITNGDGSTGFVIHGLNAGDHFGYSVSGAGDTNGDGFDDLIIGAPDANNGDGSAYIVLGGPAGGGFGLPSPLMLGDSGENILTGSGVQDFLIGAQGNDQLTGNGGADVYIGGSGDDQFFISDLDFKRIDGGTGYDELYFDNSDLTLDLDNFTNKITDIEEIYLSGGDADNNTLILDLNDLFDISSTSNILLVESGIGGEPQSSTVIADLTGGGFTGPTVSGNYTFYEGDNATLIISNDITMQITTDGIG